MNFKTFVENVDTAGSSALYEDNGVRYATLLVSVVVLAITSIVAVIVFLISTFGPWSLAVVPVILALARVIYAGVKAK